LCSLEGGKHHRLLLVKTALVKEVKIFYREWEIMKGTTEGNSNSQFRMTHRGGTGGAAFFALKKAAISRLSHPHFSPHFGENGVRRRGEKGLVFRRREAAPSHPYARLISN
jgi:hypothetical protein